VRALAASPLLVRLTDLNLSHNAIGSEGAQALAASPHLARLTKVHLSRIGIGLDGARALATSLYLGRLTTLDLSDNYLCDEGARALAASPHLANLRYLDLSDNGIGAEGAQALAQSPPPSRPGHLRHLVAAPDPARVTGGDAPGEDFLLDQVLRLNRREESPPAAGYLPPVGTVQLLPALWGRR
jgi:Ran GTPase-activating protein (RanGAP) involved in mRNA processing and transport